MNLNLLNKPILLTFFLFFSILSCDKFGCQMQKNSNQLMVASSIDYPPFEFYKNGEIVGFEIELIKLVAEKLNKTVEIKDVSFDSIIGGLQSKRYDLAISALSESEERKKKVEFSRPYHRSISVMLLRSDSEIKEFSQLANKVIGVQMGTTYESVARNEWQKTIENLQIRSLPKVPDLLQDFQSGRLDAIVLGSHEGQKIIESRKDLKSVVIPGSETVYSIAFPLGSTELVQSINTVLTQLEQSGTLKQLEQKWFGSHISE